jgi:anthranilate synthase component I
MRFVFKTRTKKLLADTLTPVNIYLKLRDVFAASILLESSDYHGHENSLSFICCEPVASFQVANEMVESRFPDKTKTIVTLTNRNQVLQSLDAFRTSFESAEPHTKYISSGLFGYMNYDSVRYFEDIKLKISDRIIPDVLYKIYKYVIVIDHFSNELVLFENYLNEEEASGLEKLEKIICSNRFSTFPFKATEQGQTNSL